MSKIVAALAAMAVLALPLQSMASQSQPTPSTDASQASVAPAGASTATPVTEAKELPAIVVSTPTPHIWTYQKGNSTVLVLGTVYPEPEGLTFVPGSINHALSRSGAVIGMPWFHFSANVNLFNVIGIWRAATGAKELPDGKRLSDVLSPADLQQWKRLSAQYRPGSDTERMLPMYAGWKLYEAVLKHSGVAVDSTTYDLIKREADKRGIPMVDAQFHWIIKDPKTAAHAFQPSPEADMACFQTILHGIQDVPDSSRTLAEAWAKGDVATMQAYLDTHTLTRPCWATATQVAIAEQQGLNREEEERKAWLAAFDTAAAKYPVVFTTASVQDIFKPAHQIAWLMQDGYVQVQPDAMPAAAPTTGAANAVSGASNP